jgi:hypothetical protein
LKNKTRSVMPQMKIKCEGGSVLYAVYWGSFTRGLTVSGRRLETAAQEKETGNFNPTSQAGTNNSS